MWRSPSLTRFAFAERVPARFQMFGVGRPRDVGVRAVQVAQPADVPVCDYVGPDQRLLARYARPNLWFAFAMMSSAVAGPVTLPLPAKPRSLFAFRFASDFDR